LMVVFATSRHNHDNKNHSQFHHIFLERETWKQKAFFATKTFAIFPRHLNMPLILTIQEQPHTEKTMLVEKFFLFKRCVFAL